MLLTCFSTYKSFANSGFGKQIIFILHYNGSLVTWSVVSLTTDKFKPLTFGISGFALSYAATIFSPMILYDLLLVDWSFVA
jgi:uncharacterized membrane protein